MEKIVLENDVALQGVYKPSSNAEAKELFAEAFARAPEVVQKVAELISEGMREAADKERVIRHYANLIALGALAKVHISFQGKEIQEVLNDMVDFYASSLRTYLFEHGIRDADAIELKLKAAAEKEGGAA